MSVSVITKELIGGNFSPSNQQLPMPSHILSLAEDDVIAPETES